MAEDATKVRLSASRRERANHAECREKRRLVAQCGPHAPREESVCADGRGNSTKRHPHAEREGHTRASRCGRKMIRPQTTAPIAAMSTAPAEISRAARMCSLCSFVT